MLIIIPSWINLLLKTYAFIGIFGLYGPINALIEVFGFDPTQILFTDFSFVFVCGLYFYSIYDFSDFQCIR